MRQDLERLEYESLLYDFYGVLLSDAQRDIMALYHEDNLTLSEIAEELSQTRQAVHYTLKKAEKALSEYEEKLGLIKQYKDRQMRSARLAKLIAISGLGQADKAEASELLEMMAE